MFCFLVARGIAGFFRNVQTVVTSFEIIDQNAVVNMKKNRRNSIYFNHMIENKIETIFNFNNLVIRIILKFIITVTIIIINMRILLDRGNRVKPVIYNIVQHHRNGQSMIFVYTEITKNDALYIF